MTGFYMSAPNAIPDFRILEHGSPTEVQREQIEAWITHGTSTAAAKALGASGTNICRARLIVQKRAEKAGYTATFDATRHVPSSEQVIGRSVYTKDEEGNPIWLKTKAKVEEEKKAFEHFITGLCSKIKPAKKSAKPKPKTNSDLMSAIFIGDAHIGMYAYAPETKHSDFDSDIAAQGLRDAIDNLIERSPDAETGMLVDVGDFMHSNSSLNKTFAGTDVDVDTRYGRVLEIAGEVMQYAITQMLKKFKKVVVVVAKGNHNPDSATAIQQITKAYFHQEPRVDVLRTSGFFHYIEWGKWLIGVNHGDKVKAPRLVNVMARDMSQAWGRTTHRMWATGHFHHQQVVELDGCVVYKFGALPPPDGWHASMGFGGDGCMQMMTFRKEGGIHSTLIYDLPRPPAEPDRRM